MYDSDADIVILITIIIISWYHDLIDFFMQLETAGFSVLEECCDAHDVCYHTCNSAKATCDKEFRKCLQTICATLQRHVSKDMHLGMYTLL